MKVNYAIHYHINNGCDGDTLGEYICNHPRYAGSDFPEDEEEFDEKMSFRKSEGWESIGHISRDGLHVEILYMEVRN